MLLEYVTAKWSMLLTVRKHTLCCCLSMCGWVCFRLHLCGCICVFLAFLISNVCFSFPFYLKFEITLDRLYHRRQKKLCHDLEIDVHDSLVSGNR